MLRIYFIEEVKFEEKIAGDMLDSKKVTERRVVDTEDLAKTKALRD